MVLLQVLEHIASVGQASDGPGQVCRWLTDVLTMFAGDTVPADEEAVRFVLSFASSLADPGLGVAPSIQAMPSLTSLVPHYSVRQDVATPAQLVVRPRCRWSRCWVALGLDVCLCGPAVAAVSLKLSTSQGTLMQPQHNLTFTLLCLHTHACLPQEDVLYALSEGDALADLGMSGDPSSSSCQKLSPASRSEMLYLLNDEGGSTPTLAYLRSVYNPPGQARSQWANFAERVKDLALAQGITVLPKVVEEVRVLVRALGAGTEQQTVALALVCTTGSMPDTASQAVIEKPHSHSMLEPPRPKTRLLSDCCSGRVTPVVSFPAGLPAAPSEARAAAVGQLARPAAGTHSQGPYELPSSTPGTSCT